MPYDRPMPTAGRPAAGPPGPYTQSLVGLLVGTSVLVTLLERRVPGLWHQLEFSRDAVVHGELWRLVTYPWLKAEPLGLLISAVVFYLFCQVHERMWGGPRMARFVVLALLGAGVLAVPLGFVLGAVLPFGDLPYATGPEAAIDAMLMATALQAPRNQMLFGFVLPMQARTFVWLMVGFEVVSGLMSGVGRLSFTLAGLAMGYVLTPRGPNTGLMGLWTTWQRRRQRQRLYVVPPKKPDRTLH